MVSVIPDEDYGVNGVMSLILSLFRSEDTQKA